jgi:hypothetical protein
LVPGALWFNAWHADWWPWEYVWTSTKALAQAECGGSGAR